MKRFFLARSRWLSVAGLVSLVFVSSQAVHPFGSVKQAGGDPANVNNLSLPIEVKALFARSCQDCHSDRTVWPWYSYVAPVSWMVEKDVSRGRHAMNLSLWPGYSLRQKEKVLADIATAVENHEMPLRQYALIHRDAKLSQTETHILYQWARVERRKVKKQIQAGIFGSPTE